MTDENDYNEIDDDLDLLETVTFDLNPSEEMFDGSELIVEFYHGGTEVDENNNIVDISIPTSSLVKLHSYRRNASILLGYVSATTFRYIADEMDNLVAKHKKAIEDQHKKEK